VDGQFLPAEAGRLAAVRARPLQSHGHTGQRAGGLPPLGRHHRESRRGARPRRHRPADLHRGNVLLAAADHRLRQGGGRERLADATLPGTVTDPTLRGGFRYLTLFLTSPGYVDIGAVSLHYTAAPLQPDPAAYKGWFLSSDNALNKIWYAGAYTVQIDTGMSDTAKSWPYSTGETDSYDSQIPYADPSQEVIFDGGKRDRDTWQGDLSVEAPVTYLSTGDTGAVDNSLSSLAAQQLPDGYVPAEGLAGPHNTGEETTYGEYVTWFVDNMAVHYLYTGDKAYLDRWYPALVKAMAWLAQQQQSDGLISFAASGSCGHYGYTDCGTETYINALYYRNLQQMATLASAEGDSSAAAAYSAQAATVKNAINSLLWDGTVGAYRLSLQTPDVYPQDGNATAILAGVASQQQAESALAYAEDRAGHPGAAAEPVRREDVLRVRGRLRRRARRVRIPRCRTTPGRR
jgi:hypothetical protein